MTRLLAVVFVALITFAPVVSANGVEGHRWEIIGVAVIGDVFVYVNGQQLFFLPAESTVDKIVEQLNTQGCPTNHNFRFVTESYEGEVSGDSNEPGLGLVWEFMGLVFATGAVETISFGGSYLIDEELNPTEQTEVQFASGAGLVEVDTGLSPFIGTLPSVLQAVDKIPRSEFQYFNEAYFAELQAMDPESAAIIPVSGSFVAEGAGTSDEFHTSGPCVTALVTSGHDNPATSLPFAAPIIETV